MMRVWRLSVAYIGPKSRTVSPRKTKIDTEVAHITRYLETTFKVKRSRQDEKNLQGRRHTVAASQPQTVFCLYMFTVNEIVDMT